MGSRRDELQAQYDLLSERIRRMREMLVLETRVEEKLRYEKLIEQDEEERDAIELKLRHIEEDSGSVQSAFRKEKLVISLLGLAYEANCIFDDKASIGRSPECDFSLSQAPGTISNWHARIHYQSRTHKYVIEDLDSTNGTYIDGSRITRSTRLSLGSRIQLGSSLSLLFEHFESDPLATGTLIYHALDGRELARYIIVPNDKVLIGNATTEALKLPFVQPGSYLGCIVRKSDGIYLVDDNTSEESPNSIRLEDNMELELAYLNIRVTIPK